MRRFAVLLCLLCSLNAAPAIAQEQVAPPGNAGVDEYLETIPDAEGNRPVRPTPGGDEGTSTSPNAVDGRTRRELEALGDDGRAAARLAEETAARRSGDRESAAGEPVGGTADSLEDGAGAGIGTVLGQTVSAEGGGMGVTLPIILLTAVLAALAIAFTRRRGSRS